MTSLFRPGNSFPNAVDHPDPVSTKAYAVVGFCDHSFNDCFSHCLGRPLVTSQEDLVPAGERQVGRDDQAALLVDFGDEVEQQVAPLSSF